MSLCGQVMEGVCVLLYASSLFVNLDSSRGRVACREEWSSLVGYKAMQCVVSLALSLQQKRNGQALQKCTMPVKIHPASAGLQRVFTAPAPMQNTNFRSQGMHLMAVNVVLLWVNRTQQLNINMIIFFGNFNTQNTPSYGTCFVTLIILLSHT